MVLSESILLKSVHVLMEPAINTRSRPDKAESFNPEVNMDTAIIIISKKLIDCPIYSMRPFIRSLIFRIRILDMSDHAVPYGNINERRRQSRVMSDRVSMREEYDSSGRSSRGDQGLVSHSYGT